MISNTDAAGFRPGEIWRKNQGRKTFAIRHRRATVRSVKNDTTMVEGTDVLIVEDEREVARTYEMVLKRCGWKVRFAENGLEGLRMARELRPKLIVSDFNMPHMNGEQLLHALRATPEFDDTRFIMATAHAPQFQGAPQPDLILQKPFPISELVDAVRACVEG